MNSICREKIDDFVNCIIKYILEKKMNLIIKLQDRRVTAPVLISKRKFQKVFIFGQSFQIPTLSKYLYIMRLSKIKRLGLVVNEVFGTLIGWINRIYNLISH